MSVVPPIPLLSRSQPGNLLVSGTRQSGAAAHASEAGLDPKLKEAAKQFEAVFIRQMLSSLEKTTSAGTTTQASDGSIYGSMVVNTVADAIAAAGGIGLASLLTKSLQSAQLGAAGSSPFAGAPDASPGQKGAGGTLHSRAASLIVQGNEVRRQ